MVDSVKEQKKTSPSSFPGIPYYAVQFLMYEKNVNNLSAKTIKEYIFNNNITPISLIYEDEYETNIINEVYDYNTAREKATTKAKEKILKSEVIEYISTFNFSISFEKEIEKPNMDCPSSCIEEESK